MRSRSSDKMVVVAVIAVLTASACSSTAQVPQSEAAIANVDVATTAPSGEPEPFLSDERTESPATETRAQSLDRAAEEFVGAAPERLDPSAPPAGSPQVVASTGPGVTDRWITVGHWYAEDANQVRGDLGLPEAMSPREYETAQQILRRAINSTGGIAGRRLRWLLWRFNLSDYSTFAEWERAACTYFTEEHEIFVLRGGDDYGGITSCIERNDGVAVLVSMMDQDVEGYRKNPHSVSPTGISLDRRAALLIDGLHRQGFLRSSDRIGLVSWGGLPRYDRVIESVLKPMLAARGLELTAEARVDYPAGTYDIPRAIADGQGEVLRFKSQSIDKVLILANSDAAQIFIELAREHDYYPRYGFTSISGGAYGKPGRLSGKPHPLEGSVAVGWLPIKDLGLDRGLRRSPSAADRCRALMEAGGLDVYRPERTLAALQANTMCDHVLFIKAAIEAGGPAITADSFIRGAESLTAIDQAQIFSAELSRFRHDGVAAYRYLRWFKSCECFRYTSPLYKAP